MNESDFKVEFVIPEHLMGYLNDAAYNLAKLEIGVFRTLYPDGYSPDYAAAEVTNFILPKLIEKMIEHIDEIMEEES